MVSVLLAKRLQKLLYYAGHRVLVDLPVFAICRSKPLAEWFSTFTGITGVATQGNVERHDRLIVPPVVIDVLPCRITFLVAVSRPLRELYAAIHTVAISRPHQCLH
jgi:hypothetical protein